MDANLKRLIKSTAEAIYHLGPDLADDVIREMDNITCSDPDTTKALKCVARIGMIFIMMEVGKMRMPETHRDALVEEAKRILETGEV